MAIIRSNAVGDASKSMGEITYRKRGNKVIGAKRIYVNKSKTPAQINQRDAFGEIGRLSKALKPISEAGFESADGQSSQNAFVKMNKDYMAFIRSYGSFDKRLPPIHNLYNIMTDPDFDSKVFAGKGTLTAEHVFKWDGPDSLKVHVLLSRKFEPGDRISICVGYAYTRMGINMERIKMFDKELSEEDIDGLGQPDEFLADKDSMPDFDIFGHMPDDATDVHLVVTALVQHVTKEKREYSDSFYALMPSAEYEFAVAQQIVDTGVDMKVVDTHPEAFASAFSGKLSGAVLKMRDAGATDYWEFPFKDYYKNSSNAVAGIVVDAPAGKGLIDPFSGKPVDEAILVKDKAVLIRFSGAKRPDFID